MDAARPAGENANRSGLFGCLGIGVAVLALVAVIVIAINRYQDNKNEEIRTQWLEPWCQAIGEGRAEDAWHTLTTEGYRKDRNKDKYLANYQEASKKWGKLVSATVFNSQGTKQPGRPPFQTAKVQTFWEDNGKKIQINLYIELIKDADGIYRQDGGYIGSTENPGANMPGGPW
ncbi:MAG: hypothetical protein H7A51_04770 [Akkermansiaceae bacterium]|nr:hypothetical protein [Akkermansiaceae bacterium]